MKKETSLTQLRAAVSSTLLQAQLYTLESLKIQDPAYDHNHGMTEKDVQIVNDLLLHFNERVKSEKPLPGDIMLLEGYNSYHDRVVCYRGGIDALNMYGENGLYCFTAGESHVRLVKSRDKNKWTDLSFSTSGGYFLNVDPAQAKFEGYDMNQFWTWGSQGACGDGGIYFKVPVKVWSHVDHKNIY